MIKGEQPVDTIFVRDLRVETTIGVYDWERRIRQTVKLDIELGADIRAAAKTDHIDDTLSYRDVAARIETFIRGSEFLLLETLAEQCAELILNEFPTPWVQLTVSKPGAVAAASEVGVKIRRSRA